ncbi:hypothetical protein [Actinokineospora globicatena]|uniref:hypothetical protein n=1 Tax=Actinokineospora globicatena TaxID=103729 RepID=UPI0020A31AB3|nr:hypothetical protein [Actinokineospora globicatena]MCP2303438.1 hypothetical protein [Actinokineospora globicatena]GLW79428.1 hypothetical protein Aglo01_39100 [Actinokineospora globicatena]GLW86162.1 hypothetical protein Aglo02_38010 [Actinokineospora globicatena]
MTLAASAALLCVSAPTAAADNAVLGSTCYQGWYAFTVTATGGDIPAGSQWTSSWTAASQIPAEYHVLSFPRVIDYTPVNTHLVTLTNPAPIAAGTRVVLEPSGYSLTNKSRLTLKLSGYGGSTGRTFPVGEWPTC